MFVHSMDDSTIQFQMVMVITDICKPTVGAMNAGNTLLQREADALLQVQAGQSLFDAKVDWFSNQPTHCSETRTWLSATTRFTLQEDKWQ